MSSKRKVAETGRSRKKRAGEDEERRGDEEERTGGEEGRRGSEEGRRENEEGRRENEGRRRGNEERGRGNDEEREDNGGEERGRSRDNDGDEVEIEIPEHFRTCSSTLEICHWLVEKRPDILNLASQMLEAKKSLPSGSSGGSSASSAHEDKFRILDESMKCLFLRVRNPSTESLDNLVTMITGEGLHSNTSREFLERIRKSFIDYRNKFNDSIQKLVVSHKEMNRGSSRLPSASEIKELITDEVVKKILSRQLAAVNQHMLKQAGSLERLVDFVRESFKSSWKGKDLSAIKSLDHMTKDLTIPSRSGRNLCNKLTL